MSLTSFLGWLYPKKISDKDPDYLVIVTATKELNRDYPNADKLNIGGFTLMIVPKDFSERI